MTDLELRTSSHSPGSRNSRTTESFLGGWDHVLPGTEHAYMRMVEVMAEHGIDTDGRPPVWAWRGPLRLEDADSLFNAEHELSKGFATLTFRASDRLVLLSDYGHWCDALVASTGISADLWQPICRAKSSHHPEQACLVHLRIEWVTDIKPLPTTGWDILDLNTPQ